jgi:hypothetical protein
MQTQGCKMTDRELLEKAAKAAGRVWLSYHHTKGLCFRDDSFGGLIEYYWNPLTDDRDALRLAVNLGFNLNVIRGDGVFASRYETEPVIAQKEEGDLYAATRRAIVRLAAVIGESA